MVRAGINCTEACGLSQKPMDDREWLVCLTSGKLIPHCSDAENGISLEKCYGMLILRMRIELEVLWRKHLFQWMELVFSADKLQRSRPLEKIH